MRGYANGRPPTNRWEAAVQLRPPRSKNNALAFWRCPESISYTHLNLQNGLYDTLDDSFKAHTPEYLSTVQLKAAYAPDAACPLFLHYLESMLAEEEIFLIQEIMGYLLLPVNKAQKSFVFVGAPNAGKSTLLLSLIHI